MKLLQRVTTLLVLGATLGYVAAPTPVLRAGQPDEVETPDDGTERKICLELQCHEDEDGNVWTSVDLYINGVLVGSGGLAGQCINASF